MFLLFFHVFCCHFVVGYLQNPVLLYHIHIQLPSHILKNDQGVDIMYESDVSTSNKYAIHHPVADVLVPLSVGLSPSS